MENIAIIKEAYSILKTDIAFYNSTLRMKASYFPGVSEDDYPKLVYTLKAVRQDFAKILVTMNCINRSYSAFKEDKYIPLYYSPVYNGVASELGCLIEYMFAKYRVILEYFQILLEICLPPKFNDDEKKKYGQLKKSHKKYNFLLKYVAENIGDKNPLLNMEWFQQLRVDRDFIIHDGATCLVFEDKQNILFKVMTTDALDKKDIQLDSFYSNTENLIYYSRYWGLYISKLFLFGEAVLEFLLRDAKISDIDEWNLNRPEMRERDLSIDVDGKELPDIQEVLVCLLKSIIDGNDISNSNC